MANKIRYGLKSVYYAIATIDSNGAATYATPVALPGAVSLSLSPEGGQTDFWADNVKYWIGNANNGYSGSLELALLPAAFLKDVLGMIDDGKHVLIENAQATPVHFALLFQFEGDEKATRHVIYNCVAGRPDAGGSTRDGDIAPQTQSVDITATSIYNATLQTDLVKASTEDNTDTTTYNGWFSAVYQYTAPTT